MDRQIVYIGAIPQDVDQLQQNKNTMIGLGYLMQAVLGTSTVVDGLACTPNSPAALSVLVGPGSIYSLQEVDATAYGSLAADTTDQIVKQGIVTTTQTFSTPAPATTGQSVVYLIEAAYQDVDGGSTVLPYYNASNPSVAWSGPNNTGVSQNTVRKGVCAVQIKTGVAATTGTQTTPAPDAGFTGLYAVTVANGQSTVTSGNIQQLSTAPFIATKIPAVQAAIQASASNYAQDSSGSANTITVALSPAPSALTNGMPVRVKVANSSTGATVLNVNGLGNVSCTTTSGAAFTANTVVANGIYTFVYDANGTRWQLQTGSPKSYLSVRDYGASPSASASTNQTAFANWWTALVAAPPGTSGYVPCGTYNIAGQDVWDYAGSRASTGIEVFGDGVNQTCLNYTTATAPAWMMKASGGTGPSTLVGYYYNKLRDMSFYAPNVPGVAFKIGQDNGADAIQGSELSNLIFSNSNASCAGALRINGATQNTFINVQNGGSPATATSPGAGIALELVMAADNTFINCPAGNANVGIHFGDNGDPVNLGFSYGNTFLNCDIENVQYCVTQNSPNASRNLFFTGEMYTIYAGGYAVSCSAAAVASAGGALIFDDVNFPLNPLYGGGGTSPVLDPNNQVGVIFTGGAYGTVSTPVFPSSGTTYTNKTGQTQFVTWSGGAITAITLNTIGVGATVNSAMLAPGDTIAFTYTGSPAWYFRNFVN